MAENNETKAEGVSAPARKVLTLKPIKPLENKEADAPQETHAASIRIQKPVSLNPPPSIEKPQTGSAPKQEAPKAESPESPVFSKVSEENTPAASSSISAKPPQQISAPAVKPSIGIRGVEKKEQPKAEEVKKDEKPDGKITGKGPVLNNMASENPSVNPVSESVSPLFLVTSAISVLLIIGLVTLSVLQYMKIYGFTMQ